MTKPADAQVDPKTAPETTEATSTETTETTEVKTALGGETPEATETAEPEATETAEETTETPEEAEPPELSEEEQRAARVPDTEDGYELRSDFEDLDLPEGMAFEFDTDGEAAKRFRKIFHENGATQGMVDALIKEHIREQSASMTAVVEKLRTRTAAETEKLGQNASERIKNTDNFIRASIGEDLAAGLFPQLRTAKAYEAMEAMMKKFGTQAGASPPTAVSEKADPASDLRGEALLKHSFSKGIKE